MKSKFQRSDESILVLGVVRNVESRLQENIDSLERMLGRSLSGWILVESNSKDRTVEILRKNEANKRNFFFESLQSEPVPSRILAIAEARQRALRRLKEIDIKVDTVFVIDLDQNYDWENTQLVTRDREFDALFPHQNPYYDLLAFRPLNSWVDFRRYTYRDRDNLLGRAWNQLVSIPRWQLVLGRLSKPLQVKSAFGGAAQYKYETYVKGSYLNDSGTSAKTAICEHVLFHESVAGPDVKMVIDPSFRLPVKNNHSIVAKLIRKILYLARRP